MNAPHPRLLLVEGDRDKRLIPELVEKLGIRWGEANERDKWPAQIKTAGSVEQLLAPGFISTHFKASGLDALGVIVDADTDPSSRWAQVRSAISNIFPSVTSSHPPEGLVVQQLNMPRFGVWIMPDNTSPGMIETFLAHVSQVPSQGLWQHTRLYCDEAKLKHQAGFRDVHRDKACIHAWLAVQDPPGEQLHVAIKIDHLQPSAPLADPFLKWFCDVFQVSPTASAQPPTS